MLRRTSVLAGRILFGSSGSIRPVVRREWALDAPKRRMTDEKTPMIQKEAQPLPNKDTEYHGSCHCGTIKVRFRTQKSPSQLGMRSCQCSYCRLHGASFTSDAEGKLSIDIHSPESVNPYRMGTSTAEFLTCKNCGVVPAATWKRDTDGRLLSVVNVRCLHGVRDELEKHEIRWETDHELAEPEKRFDRRSRTWTPTEIE